MVELRVITFGKYLLDLVLWGRTSDSSTQIVPGLSLEASFLFSGLYFEMFSFLQQKLEENWLENPTKKRLPNRFNWKGKGLRWI